MRLQGAIIVMSLVLKEHGLFSEKKFVRKICFSDQSLFLSVFFILLNAKITVGAAWAQIPRSYSHLPRSQGPGPFPKILGQSQGSVALTAILKGL